MTIDDKLDSLAKSIRRVLLMVQEIKTESTICKTLAESHQRALHGNRRPGLVAKVAELAALNSKSKVDTITVRSVCMLLGAVGTLIATIIGAVWVH